MLALLATLITAGAHLDIAFCDLKGPTCVRWSERSDAILSQLTSQIPPRLEVTLAATLFGVDPDLAWAVQYVESRGNDHVVSKGNYGRFQVNCTVWRKKLGFTGCSELLDRRTNIWAGVWILSRFQHRFATRSGVGCRCGGAHHWVAHYNEGSRVRPGGRGESYGRLVLARMRQLEKSTAKGPRS